MANDVLCYLIIDHDNKPLIEPSKLFLNNEIDDFHDLKRQIKAENPNVLKDVDIGRTVLRKPTKALYLEDTKSLRKAIQDFEFVDLDSEGTGQGVERLGPGMKLSSLGNTDVRKDCLHVIMRVQEAYVYLSSERPLKRARTDRRIARDNDGIVLYLRPLPDRELNVAIDLCLMTATSSSGEPKVHISRARRFWEATWNYSGDGVPLCQRWEIERDETFSDNTVKVPKSCWILTEPEKFCILGLPSQRALIRVDYINALQGLFDAAGLIPSEDAWSNTSELFKNPFIGAHSGTQRDSGFILTGHPGIGKSIWLRLLLVLRLHAKLPTFFQPNSVELYYFDRKKALSFESSDFRQLFNLLRRDESEWILVDSTLDLITVPSFMYGTKTFIVQACIPCTNRLEWRKKATSMPPLYFLEPWSLSELIVGRNFQETSQTESEVARYFHDYGPIARKAYGMWYNEQKRVIDGFCRGLSPEKLRSLVLDSYSLQGDDDITHDILILHPGEDRSDFEICFPSRMVYRKVVSALGRHSSDGVEELFSIFNVTPFVRSVAGSILEEIERDRKRADSVVG